jgi:hypothetical protein
LTFATGEWIFPAKKGRLRPPKEAPIVFFLFRHRPQAGVSQRDAGDKGFRHRPVPDSRASRPQKAGSLRENMELLATKSPMFFRKSGTYI